MDGKLILKKKSNEKIDTNLYKERLITYFLYLIALTLPVVSSYFIFNLCIDKSQLTLANTISLGAILATFGSAIISSITLLQNSKLNRILSNINILYSDILFDEKWTRWPFLKRYDTKVLLDGETTSSKLENPTILFKLGSHNINISIPTTHEDFYDLPAFYNFKQMFKCNKQFKTYIINNPTCINDTPFSEIGYYFWAWDCLYDSWKNIILFKINNILIYFGTSIVISSLIYSFGYIHITNFIKFLTNL